MRRWVTLLGLAAWSLLSLSGPTGALADDGPRLDCAPVALQIGAAEVNGVHLRCTLSGAPAGDTQFVIAAGPPTAGGARPLCTGDLNGGSGLCSGLLLQRDSTDAASGPLGTLVATSLPSGQRTAVTAPPGPASQPGDGAPLTYQPLPDTGITTDTDASP
jgi:hypothetical protein